VNNNTYNGLFPISLGGWISSNASLSVPQSPAQTLIPFATPIEVVVLTNPTGDGVVITNTGVYSVNFSVQLSQSGGSNNNAQIYLRVNSTNVPSSNSNQTLRNNDLHILTAEFILRLTAGDVLRLYGTASGNGLSIVTLPASGAIPASPAVVLNVVRIG
jgi:hypothetical protein